VDVGGRLFRGHVPGGGQQPHDVEVRVVESERDRERGVDARVGDEEYLAWHESVPGGEGEPRASPPILPASLTSRKREGRRVF
jgi:hypothetical protein